MKFRGLHEDSNRQGNLKKQKSRETEIEREFDYQYAQRELTLLKSRLQVHVNSSIILLNILTYRYNVTKIVKQVLTTRFLNEVSLESKY